MSARRPHPDVRALYAAADKHAGIRSAVDKITTTAFRLGVYVGAVIGAVIVALAWAAAE